MFRTPRGVGFRVYSKLVRKKEQHKVKIDKKMLGRPVKVLYQKRWRKIYWDWGNPYVIIKGDKFFLNKISMGGVK